MITEEQIPNAVVEALLQSLGDGWGIHAALAAALNAWPNSLTTTTDDVMLVCRPALILPLPKEGE
jgi:hypothetical protein